MKRSAPFRIMAQLFLALLVVACGSGNQSPAPTNDVAGSIVENGTFNDSTAVRDSDEGFDRYSLDEAARQGLVEYEINGTGASSGDALKLHIRRLAATSITLFVRAGTVFATGSPGVQNMVGHFVSGVVLDPAVGNLQPTDTIQLDDTDLHTFYVRAYCLNFNLDNPSPNDTFQVQSVNSRVATVLDAASSRGLSMPATQAAIWMDRDHVTKHEITEKFDAATEQDLESAWELLKSLPPPT